MADYDDALIGEFGLLLGAATRLERLAARAFEEECGISHAMFEALLHLDRLDRVEDEPTMGRLADAMVLTSGGMTRLADRLVRLELVRRYSSPVDRRVQLAELTETGRAKLAEAKAVHTATLRRLYAAPLSTDERTALAAALDILNRTARAELGTLH